MDETYYGRPSHNGNPDHGLLSPNGSLFFPQPATADAKWCQASSAVVRPLLDDTSGTGLREAVALTHGDVQHLGDVTSVDMVLKRSDKG